MSATVGTVTVTTVDPNGSSRPLTNGPVILLPGGEPHLTLTGTPDRDAPVFITLVGHSPTGFLAALAVKSALDVAGHANVTFICPYLPGARQDRTEPGAPFTARLYAEMINHAEFSTVVSIDPHSDVMPALIDRHVTYRPSADTLIPKSFRTGRFVIIAPDAGAVKRAERTAADLGGVPVVHARKMRDPTTGKLSGFACDPIPDGHDALVVDDICDGGGTFLGLADATGLGADRLRLWVTHGIFSKGTDQLAEHYGRIGTTDSFPTADPHITVTPVIDGMIQYALNHACRSCRHG